MVILLMCVTVSATVSAIFDCEMTIRLKKKTGVYFFTDRGDFRHQVLTKKFIIGLHSTVYNIVETTIQFF